MSKIINVQEGNFVLLSDFSDYLDTKLVEFYSLKVGKSGQILVKFYDKKRKLVKLYERN